mmetsp:Transcript_37586/g.33647  ORF Transcript_37586/g.33647 Transcript_37586/m.33647 type:complete len:98 (+) Transcript_37586:302-595(+)
MVKYRKVHNIPNIDEYADPIEDAQNQISVVDEAQLKYFEAYAELSEQKFSQAKHFLEESVQILELLRSNLPIKADLLLDIARMYLQLSNLKEAVSYG